MTLVPWLGSSNLAVLHRILHDCCKLIGYSLGLCMTYETMVLWNSYTKTHVTRWLNTWTSHDTPMFLNSIPCPGPRVPGCRARLWSTRPPTQCGEIVFWLSFFLSLFLDSPVNWSRKPLNGLCSRHCHLWGPVSHLWGHGTFHQWSGSELRRATLH